MWLLAITCCLALPVLISGLLIARAIEPGGELTDEDRLDFAENNGGVERLYYDPIRLELESPHDAA